MTAASDVLSLLRPQLNDGVAPYRHSDGALLLWLSDGQRLIAQLKPEANPITEPFIPDIAASRQRLDPAIAYALVRVECNARTEGASPPNIEAGTSDDAVMLIGYDCPPADGSKAGFAKLNFSTNVDSLYGRVNTGNSQANVGALIAVGSPESALICSITYGSLSGTASAIFRSTDFGETWTRVYNHVDNVAILQFAYDRANSHVIGISNSGQVVRSTDDGLTWALTQSWGGLNDQASVAYGNGIWVANTQTRIFTSDDGVVWVEGVQPAVGASNSGSVRFAATGSGDTGFFLMISRAYANYRWFSSTDGVTWSQGDMGIPATGTGFALPRNQLIYNSDGGYWVAIASTTLAMKSSTIDPASAWSTFALPATTDAQSSCAVGFASGYGTVWLLKNASGSLERIYVNATDTAGGFVVRASAALLDAGTTCILQRGVNAGNYEASSLVSGVYASAIRVVDRDVLDTFDSGWMTRGPITDPADGEYYKLFVRDRDDPLGFWLYPAPSNVADIVIVTYVGIPAELTAAGDTLSLSDMYIDPLINYCMYRAANTQSSGYSASAAAAAITRFGEQLNLSRETIMSLIGAPRRDMEQL